MDAVNVIFGLLFDHFRPRPYAELDQALHTLGGYVLLAVQVNRFCTPT